MLTYEQSNVSNKIRKLIGTTDIKCLSAGPGTGKTYTICNTFMDKKVLYLCPTHASKEIILGELLPGHKHKVETVHSMVGWWLFEDIYGNKNENCKPFHPEYKTEYWSNVDLVVVEEASMLSEMLYLKILEYIDYYKLPVLFNGDKHQLPNPKVDWSVFELPYETYTLTQPMRFKDGSNIQTIVAHIKSNIDRNKHPEINFKKEFGNLGADDDVKQIEMFDEQKWHEQVSIEARGRRSFIVLAGDHASLAKIRKEVTGYEYTYFNGDIVRCLETKRPFLNGQILTVITHVVNNFGEEREKWEYGVIEDPFEIDLQKLYRNQPKWVSDDQWEEGHISIYIQKLRLKDEKGRLHDGYVLADKLSHTIVKNIRQKCKKEKIRPPEFPRFLNIQLKWLRTVHAAQGSSFDFVYIHAPSILTKKGMYNMRVKHEEHSRLIYVALSRAREQLIFLDLEQ